MYNRENEYPRGFRGVCAVSTAENRMNPEERLNADLKQEMGKRVSVRIKAKFCEAANEHMVMLDAHPERVIAYFQDRRSALPIMAIKPVCDMPLDTSSGSIV